jgi:hypothetical protein
VWSETRLVSAAVSSAYDLAPDGKRLAAMLARDVATDAAHALDVPAQLLRRPAPTRTGAQMIRETVSQWMVTKPCSC